MPHRRAKEIKNNGPFQGINDRVSSVGVPRKSRFNFKELSTAQMLADLESVTGRIIPVDDLHPEEIALKVESGVSFFKIKYKELVTRVYQLVIAGGRSSNQGPMDVSTSHWLPKISTNKGYPCVNVGTGNRCEEVKVYTHILTLAVFKGRRALMEYFESHHGDEPRQEASHMCHQRRCVNPDHLVVEEQSRNKLREVCRITGYCLNGHEGRFCILDDPISDRDSQLLCNPVLDKENSVVKHTGFSLAERVDQLQKSQVSIINTIRVSETLGELQELKQITPFSPKYLEIMKKIESLNKNLEI